MFAAVFETAFLERGGLVVAVIALGSLLGTVVFLWRWLLMRRGRVAPRRLASRVEDLVGRGELEEARTLCHMDDSALARVLLAGLRNAGRPRPDVKEQLMEVGRHEGVDLQRGLAIIETVAVVSPLLGLLGTVWGMIEVFRTIEVHGVGDAGALAGGIGTALYTTLAGLLAAIPMRVAHSALMSRSERLTVELEEHALRLLDRLQSPTDPG
jgi:biopolymer transport protein ExbB